MTESIELGDLHDLLRRLDGPGVGSNDDRERVLAQLRSDGNCLVPDLVSLLDETNVELRCRAALALAIIDASAAMNFLLPLLNDPNSTLRWYIAGLLHDFGDKRAIHVLIDRMKRDADVQVRGTAAYALGGVGDPCAIPALIETLENDREVDRLGYSPSSYAATALDDIMGTNHTRTKISSRPCSLPEIHSTAEHLKGEALEFYRQECKN